MTATELINILTLFTYDMSSLMSLGLGGLVGIAFVISANKNWI